MSFPKLIGYTTLILFGLIFVVSKFKAKPDDNHLVVTTGSVEIEVAPTVKEVQPTPPPPSPVAKAPVASDEKLPDANRIDQLFNRGEPKLPIVETIAYKSRTPWQKGRPAWLSDYASHYKTSRHFIARSLNGKPEYFKQDINEGDRINVFKQDKEISFYLLADISRCKMWFYYLDEDTNERVLLKTYNIGVGREDSSKTSGSLTPTGKFSLGDKIVIYKPKMFGYHNGEKTEMIRIFGSRWIPFDREVENCSEPARGYGIHGVPWVAGKEGELAPDCSSIGRRESDGCIRLSDYDMEELFSIIITKPTTIEIVQDFHQAKLPGHGA